MNELIECTARGIAKYKYIYCGKDDAETFVKGKKNWEFCVNEAKASIEAILNNFKSKDYGDFENAIDELEKALNDE